MCTVNTLNTHVCHGVNDDSGPKVNTARAGGPRTRRPMGRRVSRPGRNPTALPVTPTARADSPHHRHPTRGPLPHDPVRYPPPTSAVTTARELTPDHPDLRRRIVIRAKTTIQSHTPAAVYRRWPYVARVPVRRYTSSEYFFPYFM